MTARNPGVCVACLQNDLDSFAPLWQQVQSLQGLIESFNLTTDYHFVTHSQVSGFTLSTGTVLSPLLHSIYHSPVVLCSCGDRWLTLLRPRMFSPQGGVLVRALAQSWDQHRIRTWVSLSGPLMGQFSKLFLTHQHTHTHTHFLTPSLCLPVSLSLLVCHSLDACGRCQVR